MKLTLRAYRLVLFFLVLAGVSGCYSTKKYSYFQDVQIPESIPVASSFEQEIRPGDLLSITVYSDDPDANALYNQPLSGGINTQAAGGGGGTGPGLTTGYLVDSSGYINFQGLGKLPVSGLTKKELSEVLDRRLSNLLKNPYYNIRFLNHRVTILGEVGRPGVYTLQNEKNSIIDLLALSGDLTFFALRDRILVLREENGKKVSGRLDLTSKDIFNSPYYYLQANDLVYVEQSKKKIANSDQLLVRNLTILTSVVSAVAIIVSFFR